MEGVKFYEKLNEIDSYFREVKKFKTLTKEEEAELMPKIRGGDTRALEKLINANLKFVITIAKGYRNTGVCFSDLISEGNIGLLKAAKKFDERKGVKFISYAVWWIRSSIQDCIDTYINKQEVEADPYTIERTSDMYDKDTSSFADPIDDDIQFKPNMEDSVNKLMKDLNDRERKILKMYYGLGGQQSYTLEEIGKEFNITSERVRVIKDKAIVKMKCDALMSQDFDVVSDLV